MKKLKTQYMDILHDLCVGIKVEDLLTRQSVTAVQALNILRTRDCRREIHARSELAWLQSKLMARLRSPDALAILFQMLASEKLEVCIRGALAILSIGGLRNRPKARRAEKTSVDENDEKLPVMNSERARELMDAFTAFLRRRLEQAAMGEPPEVTVSQPPPAGSGDCHHD